jgi:hypothetical protein
LLEAAELEPRSAACLFLTHTVAHEVGRKALHAVAQFGV